MLPDERVFRAHVAAGPFQSGVDRGRWRLLSITWPYAIISVSADERPGAPSEYAFRFECSNYPQTAPTAQPWDVARDVALDHTHWPGGRERLAFAFNPGWKGGQCLYLPCDRLSIEGHDAWRNQYPAMMWSPTGDITQYLRIVYDLLHSSNYTGLRGA
jgi:hypothetical protein